MNPAWTMEDRQRLRFRAAYRGEPGEGFADHLHRVARERSRSDREGRALAQRIWALVFEVDHQQEDERQQGREAPIGPAQYAARWGVPERTAYRLFRETVELFDAHPGVVADELWDGVGIQQRDGEMMRLGSVSVVPR